MLGTSKFIMNLKKTNNSVEFIPRQTFSVNIDNEIYYISLICNDNFQVKVVLLNENNQIVFNILELDSDRASIIKLQNNLYVFTDSKVYIYSINNLKVEPIIISNIKLDFQGICANKNNIYAYSITKDKIIKYDKNLTMIDEYENKYSNENLRVSLDLTCNEETFFSIPIMPPKEEKYILMKKLMEHYVGFKIASQNDQINSCSFDIGENTLYISMYNLIWIIKNGIEFSYLYFKDRSLSTVFYDNDIKKLIINFVEVKGGHVRGSIIKLTNSEIKSKEMPLKDISELFEYYKNFGILTSDLIGENIKHTNPKLK